MQVSLNQTNILDKVVVTKLIKKSFNLALCELFEYMIMINIHNFAISQK